MFLNVVNKPKYKTNLMFSICLVVACGLESFKAWLWTTSENQAFFLGGSL